MTNVKGLIVDDELATINLVNAYLKPEKYDVYMATDGPSALQAARAYKPDLNRIGCDASRDGRNGSFDPTAA